MEARQHRRFVLFGCQDRRYPHMKYQGPLRAVSARFLVGSSVQEEGLTLGPFSISHRFAVKCHALNRLIHRLAHRHLYPLRLLEFRLLKLLSDEPLRQSTQAHEL